VGNVSICEIEEKIIMGSFEEVSAKRKKMNVNVGSIINY
jgi:hypothetical protein